MSSVILVEILDRVAVLTINRPEKLNALNEDVRSELLNALAQLQNDDSHPPPRQNPLIMAITGFGKESIELKSVLF